MALALLRVCAPGHGNCVVEPLAATSSVGMHTGQSLNHGVAAGAAELVRISLRHGRTIRV
eukprot:NODE_2307_length_2240_cov_12.788452.p14 GENE.NODE_2307_length_2240_cov_12.788452~~NODE_2307_length_2240_cov_12.788452.p14  ORF type:complete len:60 (-),score=10.09 NODE_2307_length_2240_cov_12.788452:1351-1530(-)